MRNLLTAVAALFVLLLLGHYGLVFFGDASEEVMSSVEWGKDAAGLVLALAVLFFTMTSRSGHPI
jgi:hypothetical protein